MSAGALRAVTRLLIFRRTVDSAPLNPEIDLRKRASWTPVWTPNLGLQCSPIVGSWKRVHRRVVSFPPVDLMVGTQTCDEALQFDRLNSARDGFCDLG
jgi:hypothetical protein